MIDMKEKKLAGLHARSRVMAQSRVGEAISGGSSVMGIHVR